MALINLKGLGRISGRVGNVVFRYKNGKTYVSARPSHYNSPKTKEVTGRRLRFKITGQLARTLNKDELLKSLWGKTSNKMSACNAIFKSIYDDVGEEGVMNFSIFPGYGFNIEPKVIENNTDKLRIRVNAAESMARESIKDTCKYIKMITVFDCIDYYDNSNVFFRNVSELKEIKENMDTEFEISYNINETKLNKCDCQKLNQNKMKQIFIAFALLDENNEFLMNTWTYNLNENK